MKKTITVLLSLLMILSLAACGSKEAAAPAPTPTPAPTPAPTEVPFNVALANANEKLTQVQSMHMDMNMEIDMEIVMAMGEMKQQLPMNISMNLGMDEIKEPLQTKLTASISAMDENMSGLVYLVQEGENTIVYTSNDNGATWSKQLNPQGNQMPQSPTETLDIFTDEVLDVQKTGTEEVNGKQATVYSGKVDGKLMQKILSSTGAASELVESLGADMAEETLANLSDIGVTFMIDEESGLPVRFIIDMTDAIEELMRATLLANLGGGEMPEGMELTVDATAMSLDVTLSDFDAIGSIEIPEAALNAPEA